MDNNVRLRVTIQWGASKCQFYRLFLKSGYLEKVDILKNWMFRKNGYFEKVDILNEILIGLIPRTL